MIEILKTFEDGIHYLDSIETGCWVVMTDPSATELLEISESCHIDIDHLRAPLDEEERSRIEVEDDYTLILVDIPTMEERNDKDRYVTIPLAIIVAKDLIITVCLEDGMEVFIEDGVAKLPDRKAFAGSVATADRLVRTMVKSAGVPLIDAIRMISITPAKVIGIDDRKGSLAPGKDADIVIFDSDIDIKTTIIKGKTVYEKK